MVKEKTISRRAIMNAQSFDESGRKLTYSFPEMDGENLLRELILYVSRRCEADPTFGAVKLNKILFFADFASYIEHGKPITGVAYEKLQYGPVPQLMRASLAKLEREGSISRVRQPFFAYEQIRVVANRDANLDVFTATDIALVDEIIQTYWNRFAAEVSSLSHGIAWESAKDGELIPYEAFLLSDEELTEEEINRAEELIKQHGWDV
jgi:hypothetical protein